MFATKPVVDVITQFGEETQNRVTVDLALSGDGVEFDVADSPKGPRAENVRRTTT